MNTTTTLSSLNPRFIQYGVDNNSNKGQFIPMFENDEKQTNNNKGKSLYVER
jgi:hypothetical protein